MRIGIQSTIRKMCNVMNEPVFVVDEEGIIKYKNTLSHSIFQQLCINKNFTLFYPDMKNWHYFYHYLVKRNKNNCQDIPILNDKNQLYYMSLNIIEIEHTGMFLIKILSSRTEFQLSSQKAVAYNNLMRVFDEVKQAVILTDYNGNVLYYNDLFEILLNINAFKGQFNYFDQIFDQFNYSPKDLTNYYKGIGQYSFGRLTIHYKNDKDNKDIKVVSVECKDLEILVTTLYVEDRNRVTSESSIDLGIRLLGENTAKILHEINNPLTSLKGYVDLMVLKEEFNLNYLSIIQQELQKIELLTSDLLKLSNPRNDRYDCIAINTLVEECINLLSVEAHCSECEIFLHTDVAPESFIFVNKTRIQQVLINILKNSLEAIKQYKKLGIINIVITKVLNQFKISISDNGPGINKENLDKIFHSFFTTKEGGTGLGLSISKQLIEEHSGKLLVESEEGVGTTFSIYLPMHIPAIPTNYIQETGQLHRDFDNV